MSKPLPLTNDQREGLVSGKVSSIILMDTSFSLDSEEYDAISESDGSNWGVRFTIRDVMIVPVRKLKKNGFSNDFVKEFKEKHGSEREVAVARIRIRKAIRSFIDV